jgi:hypothetical protein
MFTLFEELELHPTATTMIAAIRAWLNADELRCAKGITVRAPLTGESGSEVMVS